MLLPYTCLLMHSCLLMLSIWTTKLLADASLLRSVRMLGLGKNLHLYGEQKLFALQLPKAQQFHHRRAVKVMDWHVKDTAAMWGWNQHRRSLHSSGPLLGLAGVFQQMLSFKYLTAQPGTPVFDVSPFIHPFNAKFDLVSWVCQESWA